jgi:hypothetical protein
MINGMIPTIIADTGAASTCVIPNNEQLQTSECGMFRWDAPYVNSGVKLNKIFEMAQGDTEAAGKEVQLNALSLREGTATGHTISGLYNSLLSLNQLINRGYIPIFIEDKIGIYDS